MKLIYPLINDFGEIVWKYQPARIVDGLKNYKLAVYDWSEKAYVSQPTTLDLVLKIADFSRQYQCTVQPNREFGLTLENAENLIDHFFMTRFRLSRSRTCFGELNKTPVERLSPFTMAAVQYAVHSRCCFIADPDEVERKIIALAAVHQVEGYPCLLVCRQQERDFWIYQAQQHLCEGIQIIDGHMVNANTPRESLWIVDYRDLEHGYYPNPGLHYRSIIVDYASYIKNPQAQRTKMVAALARTVQYRFLTTNFPVNITPSDLVTPLKLLNKEQEFSSLNDFFNQVGPNPMDNRTVLDYFTYQKKLGLLYRKLRSTCLVRRAEDPGVCIQDHLEFIKLNQPPENIQTDLIASPLRRLGIEKIQEAAAWLSDFLNNYSGNVLIIAHHNDVIENLSKMLNLPAIYGKIGSEKLRMANALQMSQNGARAIIIANDVELKWEFDEVTALVFVELLITPMQLYAIAHYLVGVESGKTIPAYWLYSNHPLDLDALKRLKLRLSDYSMVMDQYEV